MSKLHLGQFQNFMEFPLWHSGLRIQRCHSHGGGRSCGLDSGSFTWELLNTMGGAKPKPNQTKPMEMHANVHGSVIHNQTVATTQYIYQWMTG